MTIRRVTMAWPFFLVPLAAGVVWFVSPDDSEPTDSSLNVHVATYPSYVASSPPTREDGGRLRQGGHTTGSSEPSPAPNDGLRHGVHAPVTAVGAAAAIAATSPAVDDAWQDVAMSQPPNRGWIWQERAGDRWRFEDPHFPDLKGRDFRQADLTRVDLADADLRGANLEGAVLRMADLRSANLQGAVIKKTVFSSSDLRDAVLRETEMEPPINLMGADLRGADLRRARLGCQDCSFMSPMLFANLNGADLRGTQFGRSHISRAVFEEADLRGANLAATRGLPASLRGALYDRDTRLPEGIDPEQWNMVYVP